MPLAEEAGCYTTLRVIASFHYFFTPESGSTGHAVGAKLEAPVRDRSREIRNGLKW